MTNTSSIFFLYIYNDRQPIIIAHVNHNSMFIQMSVRMNGCTMKYTLIFLITDKIKKEKGITSSIIIQ